MGKGSWEKRETGKRGVKWLRKCEGRAEKMGKRGECIGVR